MIQNLHPNLCRYVHLQMQQMDDVERVSSAYASLREAPPTRSQKEHYQLLDACQERDTKAAVKLLKRHIDSAAKQLQKSQTIQQEKLGSGKDVVITKLNC